jgi:hypothetical protein
MESSGQNIIEYIFTASVTGLEKGVNQVKNLIKEAGDTAKDFGEEVSEGFYQATGSINDLDAKTQALMASITALEVVFAKDSLSAFATYEDAIYGMATTVGNVGGTIEQAMEGIRQTTANGLLSEADSAKAINNLTSFGYSVQEATTLIEALTVSSEAHRRTNMTVAEQVVQTTEGIRRQSSMMARASGNSETLSQAEERYAQALGKTASELTEAEKKQAIFNSYVDAGNSSLSVAEGYENSYSASVQRLGNSMENLKVAFGQALAPLMTWIANATAWIVQNKQLVLGIGTFVGVLIGSGGVFVALAKIIPAIRSAVAWFTALSSAGKGLVGVLSLVATGLAVVATVNAINSMNTGLENIAESSQEASNGMDDFTASVGGGGATGAVRDLSKELEKLTRQYKDELKQIEQRHQETIDKLTTQIQEANVDYKRAVDERNAEFAVQQAKEEKKHQEKVDEIMTQIRFLQRYNNEYNKQKLTNLEFALAKENALYQKQTDAEKAELELQNENDRIAFEKKTAQLQAELDEELAFMEKHRLDLQEVQGWILEDEIEALKRRYEEQKASYDEQSALAGSSGAEVGKNFLDNLKTTFDNADMSSIYQAGGRAGTKFSKGFFNYLWNDVGSGQGGILADIWKFLLGEETFNQLMNQKASSGGGGGTQGWATGGYTGQGGVNEVAGIVHKGEYVLPQEMVDQTTGTPKALGNTYIINVSGTFATSQAERRKVADQIVQAINQNNKSRLEASWQ